MLPILFRPLLAICLPLLATTSLTNLAASQDSPPPPKVEVPVWPNAHCPIMGKKVSLPLFVDTDLGRFYVCCKPCFKKILADVPAAYQTAFPVTQELANEVCPVSGRAIGEKHVVAQLQGYSFRLCSEACRPTAIADSQLVLARLLVEGIREVGNRSCPVTGEAVQTNAFVLVDKQLIHLASPAQVAAVEKAPAAMLKKAQEIARSQPPAPQPKPVEGDK